MKSMNLNYKMSSLGFYSLKKIRNPNPNSRKRILKLHFYGVSIVFSMFQFITETLVYDFWSLVNGVGGLMGLVLGVSALSLTQTFLDFIINKFSV